MQAARLTRIQQKQRTRDRLLSAASRVIARRGLGGASVDEISEQAGFSSGAFYSNFESKDDAFAAALEYHAADFMRFSDSHGAAGSVADRLRADQEWLDEIEDWQVLFWMEIVAQGGRSDRLSPVVRDYFDASRSSLAERMERGAQESGRPLPRPARELAALVLAAEIGLFIQRMVDREAADPALLGTLVELFFEREADLAANERRGGP